MTMTTQTENKAPRDQAEVAFHPPVLLLLCIIGGFIERWIMPAPFLPPALAWPIGIPIVVLAFALFSWAVVMMRRGGASIPTNTATDVIIEQGPFRFSRNPIYLSMTLLLIGIGCWANSIWFLTWAAVAVILLSVYVIKREERYLEDKFDGAYLSYKRRVRRWI
jgi:protein-S-isoprenylcysteine O-methyltransferase Ste14